MNEPETPRTEEPEARFASLAQLRAAHRELLRQREEDDDPAFVGEVVAFVDRASDTGAVLDGDEDRWAAQGILDYWANRLYRGGRSIDPVLADFDPSLAPELADSDCPYVGLNAFDQETGRYFFGRDVLTARLIERLGKLDASRLMAVIGPSGSGKSSLVLAGVLTRLKGGALLGSEDWHYPKPMVPGSNPLASLAATIRPPDTGDGDWVEEEAKALAESPRRLGERLAELWDGPVVLVIDQFEEIFTLASETVQKPFIDSLVELCRDAEHGHVVIVTMRSDFETHVVKFPELHKLFEANEVRVTPMSAAELREAIEVPAREVGLVFAPGLVDELVREILGEPAGLPLLQFTLLKLWERRERNRVTWEAFRKLGGCRNAVASAAEELYEELLPEQQATLKRILLRLSYSGERVEILSNRIRRSSLYAAGEASERVDLVLGKLIEARLVHPISGDTSADEQLEVAHEALIRNWPRLVGWLEDERVRLRKRAKFTAALKDWSTQDEHPAFLLRGQALEEAQRLDRLSNEEKRYIEASRSWRDQRREAQESVLIWTQGIATVAIALIALYMKWQLNAPFHSWFLGSIIVSALMLIFVTRPVISRMRATEQTAFTVDKAVWLFFWFDLFALTYLVYYSGGLALSPFSAFLIVLPTNGIILGQEVRRVTWYYVWVFAFAVLLIFKIHGAEDLTPTKLAELHQTFNQLGPVVVFFVFLTLWIGYKEVHKARQAASGG